MSGLSCVKVDNQGGTIVDSVKEYSITSIY